MSFRDRWRTRQAGGWLLRSRAVVQPLLGRMIRKPARRNPVWSLVRLGLLAAAFLMIVTASISYSNTKLRQRKTWITIAEVTDAVLRFQYDFQRPPDSLEQLLRPPADQPPYLQSLPLDAWGREFRYIRILEPGSVGSFRIISDGPDREPDTEDDIENL